jgi:3-oxoacyl-[acyl-carrier protein] reductase
MGVTFDFTGSHVLVTGGTSGIGHAIAHAFHDSGAAVTVTGTRTDPGEYDIDLSAFTYRQCRMAAPEEIGALVSSLATLDVLVNNAGQNLPGGRDESDPDVFEEVVAVNLFGAFRLATLGRALLERSPLEGGGSLVNVASMAAYFGMEIVPGYGAAKAGIVQMTKTFAVAWARRGIRVNAIAPGVVHTAMTAPMMGYDAITAPLLARTPMGRFASPEEIAPVALFLASPAARYVTGQTLPVDGGFSIAG